MLLEYLLAIFVVFLPNFVRSFVPFVAFRCVVIDNSNWYLNRIYRQLSILRQFFFRQSGLKYGKNLFFLNDFCLVIGACVSVCIANWFVNFPKVSKKKKTQSKSIHVYCIKKCYICMLKTATICVSACNFFVSVELVCIRETAKEFHVDKMQSKKPNRYVYTN